MKRTKAPPPNEPWLDQAIQSLRTPVAPSIAGQLRAARRTALQPAVPKPSSYWQWGLAASIVVVSLLGLTVWQIYPTETTQPLALAPAIAVDDLPIMTAQDELQFYQDLDFIQWLAKDKLGEKG